jgi:hypothetical protein
MQDCGHATPIENRSPAGKAQISETQDATSRLDEDRGNGFQEPETENPRPFRQIRGIFSTSDAAAIFTMPPWNFQNVSANIFGDWGTH